MQHAQDDPHHGGQLSAAPEAAALFFPVAPAAAFFIPPLFALPAMQQDLQHHGAGAAPQAPVVVRPPKVANETARKSGARARINAAFDALSKRQERYEVVAQAALAPDAPDRQVKLKTPGRCSSSDKETIVAQYALQQLTGDEAFLEWLNQDAGEKDASAPTARLGVCRTFAVLAVEGDANSPHLILRVRPEELEAADLLAIARALILPRIASENGGSVLAALLIQVLGHHMPRELVVAACAPDTQLDHWLERVDSRLAADCHPLRSDKVMLNRFWMAMADMQILLANGWRNGQQPGDSLQQPRKRARSIGDDRDRPAKRL